MLLSKTLALPPTFVEEWRQAIERMRGPPSPLKQPLIECGPPSPFQQLSEAIERMRGPPSPLKQSISKLIEEGTYLDEVPDAQAPQRAPAPSAPRGRPPVHDWPRIIQFDAEVCRGRVPSWKEREDALIDKLAPAATPHLKTLQQHLPKAALLKERNSRSI